MKIKSYLLILSLCISNLTASGSCDAVLIRDLDITRTSRAVQLAWLKTIKKEQFTSDRDTAGFKLFGIFGSWEDFEMQRKKIFAQEKFDLNEKESLELIRASVSKEAIRAWLECQGAPGIALSVSTPDESTVIVDFQFKAPKGTPVKRQIQFEFENGISRQLPKFLDRDYHLTLVFKKKDTKSSFSLAVNVDNAWSSHVTIPVLEPARTPTPSIDTRKDLDPGKQQLRLIGQTHPWDQAEISYSGFWWNKKKADGGKRLNGGIIITAENLIDGKRLTWVLSESKPTCVVPPGYDIYARVSDPCASDNFLDAEHPLKLRVVTTALPNSML